jgi:hypothetical protein
MPTDSNATGGATQNTTQQGGGTEEKPEFVTKEDMTAIVNAAVTSQLKRSLDKGIAAALEPALKHALAPFHEKLEKAPEPPAPGGGGNEKPKGDDPQVTALKKQLDDVTAGLKAAQDEAALEKRKSMDQTARGQLRSELSGKVRPEAIEDVVDLLFFRKRVAHDDQGNLTFTWRSSLSKGLPEEDHQFPLADGVREFLKSKQAEMYLPPPNTDKNKLAGSKLPNGSTLPPVGRYDKPAVTEDEKLKRAEEITQALIARGVGSGLP